MTREIKPLRVGIVGCGKVAEHHARFVNELADARLVGVADTNRDAARDFAGRHHVSLACGSLRELLSSADLDVLHVVTPPAFHYQTAKVALDHGLHVFLEKPLAFTVEEVHDLYERAARQGVLLCPDFIQLFHPRMQELLGVVQSGQLGRLLHVESHLCFNLDDTPELREAEGLHWAYKLPGGLLRDYSSHVLYLALYLAGTPRHMQVSSDSSGTLPQGLSDHLVIQLEASECTATALLSCKARSSAYGVRVFCEQGSAEVDFGTQTLQVFRRGALPRAVSSATAGFSRGYRLGRQSAANIFNYLRGALVPYGGLRVLIPLYYESIRRKSMPPISRDLALAVSQAEETIFSDSRPPIARGFYSASLQTNTPRAERILVTGAGGYVGSAVAKALADAGYYVRAMVRPTSRLDQLQKLGVEIFLGDVRRTDDVIAAAAGMDAIAHIAAGVRGTPAFVVDSSVRGTQAVADAAIQAGVRRVIYMSSMSVYDLTQLRNGERIAEASPLEELPESRGAYSLGKRKAEDIALRHLSDVSPAWTILRPSFIVGNGRDVFAPVGPQIGRKVVCLNRRRNRLLLVHVEDVAAAIVAVLHSQDTKNQIYTLSHPDEIRVRDYVEICRQQDAQRKVRVIYVPYAAIRLAAGFSSLLHKLTPRFPSISPRRLVSAYRNVRADSKNLCEQTGWQPAPGLLQRLAAEMRSDPGADEARLEEISATEVSL
jgi:predicted dehydrogenase/nucleoside-diphosphate-sugar epimerase